MNREQKAYALAKARYEAAREAEKDAEAAYIARHGIKNDDGTIPRALYAIKCDDDRYEEIIAEIDANGELRDVYAEVTEAALALRKAEDALIEYGLGLLPAEPAATLRRAKDRPKYRDRIIELTFQLDTRTVKRRGA